MEQSIELIKLMVLCFTATSIVLPLAFLVALSLPQTNEFRQFILQLNADASR